MNNRHALHLAIGLLATAGLACSRREPARTTAPTPMTPATQAAAAGAARFVTGRFEGRFKPPALKPGDDLLRDHPEWYPNGQPNNPYPPGIMIPINPPGTTTPTAPSAPTAPQGGLQPIPAPSGAPTAVPSAPQGGLQPIPPPGVPVNPTGQLPGLQPMPGVGGNPPTAFPPPTTPQPAPQGGGAAAVHQTWQGTLGPGGATSTEGRFEREHRVNLRRGQRVAVTLNGSFDTILRVAPPTGDTMENDDVAPGDLNSRLDFTAPLDGSYRVVATSYEPGATGEYTIRLDATEPGEGMVVTGGSNPTAPTGGPDAQTGAGGTLVPGTPVNEFLSPGDPSSGGRYVRAYRLNGRAGDMVSLRVDSTAFDTTLTVTSPTGQRWFNDDAAQGNTNSALSVTLPADGVYRVEVSSYRDNETGPFALNVTAAGRPTVGPGGAPTGNVAGRNGRGNVYGIFVGITDYGGRGNLYGCADDARQLAQAYINARLGRAENFVVLTDAEATTSAVRQAFATMAQRVSPEDVFVFFHSGHGGRRAVTSPDPTEPDGHIETIVMRDGDIDSHQLSELFDPVRANVNMLALDSCFSGGFQRAFASQPNRYGMYSSEEDVLSTVAQRYQAGGYLSYFLRRGVTEGDGNRDTTLRAGELSDYLHRQFATNRDQLGTHDDAGNATWQHLVVNRTGITLNDLLWRFPQ